MRGLKIVKYYNKIINRYTLEKAMLDSLCFDKESKETKTLVALADNEILRKCICNTDLYIDELLMYNKISERDYIMFIKLYADVLNNIDVIKEYLANHKDILTYQRKKIIPGILNMDFLREGNFIKIKGNYYNLEIIFYVMTNDKPNVKELYDYFVTSTEQYNVNNVDNVDDGVFEEYRKSIFYDYIYKLKEDIIPYTDLSETKDFKEIIPLLCENTKYDEIWVNICISRLENQKKDNFGKGFYYYYPMTAKYIDLVWFKKQINYLETRLMETSNLKQHYILMKEIEELEVCLNSRILGNSRELQLANKKYVKWNFLKDIFG